MFLSLPVLARSKKTPKISEWVSGLDTPSVWDDDFDKFCDVVKTVFEGFLSRLMRACESLTAVVDGWPKKINWSLYSQYLEHGVDSPWAGRCDSLENRGRAATGRNGREGLPCRVDYGAGP